MEEKLRVQSEETLRIHKKRLAQAEKRIGELDRLFIRSYEDNVSGKIDDERFAMMNKSYTQEQKDLKAEVISLQQVIEEQERQAENLEQFIQRVKRNSDPTELLASFTLCFIDRTDFTTGIFDEKFVEPVLDTCNIVIRAVGVNGIKVVVDGNIPNAVLRESVVDIKSLQCGVSTKS